MTNALTPRQQILLWDLISRGGSALQKELKPDVAPRDREPLVRAKMISVVKTPSRALRLTIEDAGWSHVSSTRPTLVKAGESSICERVILQFVLSQVQAYAAATGISYAEIFSGPANTAESGGDGKVIRDPPRPIPIQTAIRAAFFDIAGRPARDGVRLRALREALPHVDRADLDAALLKMRQSGAANLMNLDNPRDIAAEGDAPLKAGSQTFHLLWIDP